MSWVVDIGLCEICCVDAPCDCPCTSWPPPTYCTNVPDMSDCYVIDGYSNTMFAPCSECNDSSATAWDGKYDADAGVYCQWEVRSGTFSINGKTLYNDNCRVFLNSYYCYWGIWVACYGGGTSHLIWEGRKYYGITPAGIYDTTGGGCDTGISSISLSAC